MAGDRRGHLLGRVRTLFDAGTVTGLTDGQLLERFATRRGDASDLAFAALVERHGPMVLRACRGILGDDHEAMDAFQATFLVLARKGGSLWVRDSLGPWLHRVACRAAGRAKRASARRLASERKAVEMAEPRNVDADRDELAAIIHEEVDRLPERYRSAVVLCDLEGRTCEDAARHLGCPVGTVGSRLSRGRDRLRDRLTRRGLAPRGGLASGMAAWHGPREPLPPELVGATVAAAARFVSNQAASQGLAASLALGVLRSMAMTSWWKVATILLAATASTSGVVSLAGLGAAVEKGKPHDPPQPARADGGPVVEVRSGKFSVILKERGSLEASRNNDVLCPVGVSTAIINLLPEGTRVKKGQLVCELDCAVLRDQLTNQRISIAQAANAYEKAKLAREVAEIALKEYVDGVYPSERTSAQGAIREAELSITQAEARLKRARNARLRLDAILRGRNAREGTAVEVAAELDVDDRLAAAELAVPRERLALEICQNKLGILEKFTKDRTVKELKLEIETVFAAEMAKQNARDLEKSKGSKLEREITKSQLFAPSDGLVVLAEDIIPTDMRPKPLVKVGTTVREGQKIFSVPDLASIRVAAKAREATVHQLKPGQTARIKVDAFPDEAFTGVVEDVAPRPDPSRISSQGVKVYTTNIALTKGFPSFRPGMTADVEILVDSLDDVVSVPIKAVVSYDDKYHVGVKTPDGEIDWREVELGVSNDHAVEVKSGLKSGEAVVLDPAPLLSEEQKRKVKYPPPSKPAGAK